LRIVPTMVAVEQDFSPVRSPLDGQVLTSHAQRREHMRRHGVIDARDMPLKDGIKRHEKWREADRRLIENG